MQSQMSQQQMLQLQQLQQLQQQQMAAAQQLSQQQLANYNYRPDRSGAGATAHETNSYINQYGLVAEAAKRAEMAVLERDLNGIELSHAFHNSYWYTSKSTSVPRIAAVLLNCCQQGNALIEDRWRPIPPIQA